MNHDLLCPIGYNSKTNPNCECDWIAAIRADERAEIYSKVSKLELPSYLSNQLLRLDDVTDLLRGGEQE